MPELPEVETVRRGLEPILVGAQIIHIEIRRQGLRFPFPIHLDSSLMGKTIVAIRRRAKYLLFFLDNGQVLISHLGMSGAWLIESVGEETVSLIGNRKEKHDHFIMYVINNSKTSKIIYNDQRRFGLLLLCSADKLELHPILRKLGIEPMSHQLSGNFLQESFSGRYTNLKTILLDQRIICGLGNIYVSEILWRASLSPLCTADSLADSSKEKAILAAAKLADSILNVLTEALAAGGSHLKNYVHTDGSLGSFQYTFKVYGQKGKPCLRCGEKIIRFVQAGRPTFYCPSCQKEL